MVDNEAGHFFNFRKNKKTDQQKTEAAAKAGRRRSYFLAVMSLVLAGILIYRLHWLQIVNGERYLSDFKSSIRRTVVNRGKRGKIYDSHGRVLAETVSSYNITMNDMTEDSSGDQSLLNNRIKEVIDIVDENGGEMYNDFNIVLNGGSYYYKEMGSTAKMRFLADIYGYPDPADLTEEESSKTAGEIVNDLADRYGISSMGIDDRKVVLELVIARYKLSLNYYQKYISTVLAKNVPEKTREAIKTRFNSSQDGVQIEEELVRRYPKGIVYYSNIVGYTGEADEDYVNEESHSGTDEEGHPLYREGDMVGLTGIEASQEEILHAVSGQETFNVDNIGRITNTPVKNEDVSVAEQSYASKDGGDVYLTIDYGLQKSAYLIIEDNLRKIILGKLQDSIQDQEISQDQSGDSIRIPISNVYTSCLTNILDTTHFTSEEASETEKDVAEKFESFRERRSGEILAEISVPTTNYKNLGLEMRYYQKLLAQALYDYGVLTTSFEESDAGNKVYKAWDKGENTFRDLIMEYIRKDWIDTSSPYLKIESGHPKDSEIFEGILTFFDDVIGADSGTLNDRDFRNAIYKYLIINQEVTGDQVCQLLLDQKIVEIDEQEQESFDYEWGESAYQFMYNRIQNLDLTPAQLHLYPSTASAVVTDPRNGNVLALVSYPGYDANKINDESYYRQLVNDPAKPLLNYATQQLTAPGSTFKMVTATAALSEKVVTIKDTVECKKKGTFKKVKEDPDPPKCWIYPGRHKKQNLEGAIANSCNMYFYEMGYRLGLHQEREENQDNDWDDDWDDDDDDDDDDGEKTDKNYDNAYGVERIRKYAEKYGLSSVSGVEITESEPRLLSNDPIRGAIGQETNAFSTASLARYVSGVANSGNDYKLSLIQKTKTGDGEEAAHKPEREHVISLAEDQWNSIHRGMRRVATGYSAFNVLWEYPVAGKTGTAQQKDMPDNALFVGYAPYYEKGAWNEEQLSAVKKISMAVRIPNGYTSTYAANLGADIMRYFYYPEQFNDIVDQVVRNKAPDR